MTTKDIFTNLRDNLGLDLKINEPLSLHTNFKIGGPAKYFFTARTTDQLVHAAQVADELGIPFIILGGGSNILVSDTGFSGLVIEARNNKHSIKGTRVTAEAGVSLGFLVQSTVAAQLTGFEPLVAVPGTVGGAVYGNAGLPQAVRGFIGDWVTEVVVYRDNKIIHVSANECNFAYRESVFKHNQDIILSAVFNLKIGTTETSQELLKKYINARKGQPYNLPSSGCVFKNTSIIDPESIKQKFANEEKLPEFLKCGFIPSSWLIDRAGLKGKIIGQIKISEQHANYLVNTGGAKAEDVIMMISYIKQQIRDQFGIQLQEEIRYIGF